MKKQLALIAATAAATLGLIGVVTLVSNSKLVVKAQAPTPIGAWFGIARPCPAAADDSPDHAAFCQTVCGACPNIPGTLPPEVPMMPTLLADGTVLADDAGEIPRYHTTAHGKWTTNTDSSVVQVAGKTRFEATFFWLQSVPPQGAPGSLTDVVGQLGGTCCFAAGARPRFVTFFDPADPDRMAGFIQPYVFPFVDPATGLVKVNPASASDGFAGNHVPAKGLDPLAPLPACAPQNGCLGTYHFVIRRIKAQ
jgi:hypothetical protein